MHQHWPAGPQSKAVPQRLQITRRIASGLPAGGSVDCMLQGPSHPSPARGGGMGGGNVHECSRER